MKGIENIINLQHLYKDCNEYGSMVRKHLRGVTQIYYEECRKNGMVFDSQVEELINCPEDEITDVGVLYVFHQMIQKYDRSLGIKKQQIDTAKERT